MCMWESQGTDMQTDSKNGSEVWCLTATWASLALFKILQKKTRMVYFPLFLGKCIWCQVFSALKQKNVKNLSSHHEVYWVYLSRTEVRNMFSSWTYQEQRFFRSWTYQEQKFRKYSAVELIKNRGSENVPQLNLSRTEVYKMFSSWTYQEQGFVKCSAVEHIKNRFVKCLAVELIKNRGSEDVPQLNLSRSLFVQDHDHLHH